MIRDMERLSYHEHKKAKTSEFREEKKKTGYDRGINKIMYDIEKVSWTPLFILSQNK